jgi:polar amino acid transport system substrate-binding protein
MKVSILGLLCLLFVAPATRAEPTTLQIVTEPWPPYIYEEQGQPRGLDYEMAARVLKRLGVSAELKLLPWRRVLSQIESGQADAILDIFRTTEREAHLLFPEEPLSQSEMVLFYAKGRPFPFDKLEDLRGLKVGVSPGYWYANQAFREADYFIREPAPNHEANLGKLLRGRIDLLVCDRRVCEHLGRTLGIAEKIAHHPRPISRDALYLAFRKNPEMQRLATRFDAELRRFKQSAEYRRLLQLHGEEPVPHWR